ncbi:MAG: hypothetical protein J5755_00390, partial [Clostridia bacterium]|nr:hypothetical protein [Clostridia bacterium]
ASFVGDPDNYNEIADMHATITINKAVYDMSGVSFADVTVTYDGEEHVALISGDLPSGVTVSYATNSLTTVGSIEAVASFAGDSVNYEAIPELRATITINKATYDVSGITFADVEVPFDGQPHVALIAGELPQGVTVEYADNTLTEIGSITATATFLGDYANYEEIAPMHAVIKIGEAAPIANPDGSKTYVKAVDPELAAEAGVNVTAIFANAQADQAAVKEVKLNLGNGSIVFDKAAIEAIAGHDVAIQVQIQARGDEPLDPADAQLVINVTLQGAEFADGKAKVTVPFDGQVPSGRKARVYYVDADGNRTQVPASLKDGSLTFETNHFSTYILVFEKNVLSGGAIAGIVIALLLAAAIAVCVTLFVLKVKGVVRLVFPGK